MDIRSLPTLAASSSLVQPSSSVSGFLVPSSSTEFVGPEETNPIQSRVTTCYFRYLHINHDLTQNGRCKEKGLRVMVLGVGCVDENEKNHPLETPQANEIGFSMRPDQFLDLVDNKKHLINRLENEGFWYDPTPCYDFFKNIYPDASGKSVLCRLMEPVDEASEQVVRSLFTQFMQGIGLQPEDRPKHKYICWNPQVPSLLPPKIKDTYHVIVATCSALFPDYIRHDHLMPTWVKILGLLKHKGLLYVDSSSYKFAFDNYFSIEDLEKLLGCRLKVRKIKPIIKLTEAYKKHLLSNRSDFGYAQEDLKHHVGVSKQDYSSPSARGLLGADSHSVYVIERHIDQVEKLQELFINFDLKDWWHRLAKTEFNPKTYSSSGVLRMRESLQKYEYVSSDHYGWTPLHVAVLSNNPTAIEFFLSLDISVMEQVDEHGMAPADYARLYQPHLYRKFWPKLREQSMADLADQHQLQRNEELQQELPAQFQPEIDSFDGLFSEF